MSSTLPFDDTTTYSPPERDEGAPTGWTPVARSTSLPVRPGAGARRPFGYTHDRRRVVEEEAQALRIAATSVLAGETLSSIVRQWNDRGLRTAGGGPWRVNSLSTLLVQPRLAGIDGDGNRLRGGLFPPILDVDTHRRLVALHGARRKGPRRATRRYLLTGLLRCWRCGGGLHGTPTTRGSDLYICPGPAHGGCSGTAVTADHADHAVRELVLSRLDSAGFRDAFASAVAQSDHENALRQAQLDLAWHRQRLQDLAEMWATGQISRGEWVYLRRDVSGRTAEAEIEVGLLQRVGKLRRLAGTGAALRERWDEMTVEEHRGVLQAALECVVVLPAEPPRRVFRPERLHPIWVD